jgi:hypothetical protein
LVICCPGFIRGSIVSSIGIVGARVERCFATPFRWGDPTRVAGRLFGFRAPKSPRLLPSRCQNRRIVEKPSQIPSQTTGLEIAVTPRRILMASEGDFRACVAALLDRLKEAAGVGERPMNLGDLDILAAASMELLTITLANMPEPQRGERVRGLSETLAADVAQKRERLEQKIPNRRLDAPEGSA